MLQVSGYRWLRIPLFRATQNVSPQSRYLSPGTIRSNHPILLQIVGTENALIFGSIHMIVSGLHALTSKCASHRSFGSGRHEAGGLRARDRGPHFTPPNSRKARFTANPMFKHKGCLRSSETRPFSSSLNAPDQFILPNWHSFFPVSSFHLSL